jgi:hypothetical protein
VLPRRVLIMFCVVCLIIGISIRSQAQTGVTYTPTGGLQNGIVSTQVSLTITLSNCPVTSQNGVFPHYLPRLRSSMVN